MIEDGCMTLLTGHTAVGQLQRQPSLSDHSENVNNHVCVFVCPESVTGVLWVVSYLYGSGLPEPERASLS